MTRNIIVKKNITMEEVLNIFRTPKETYAFGNMYRLPNAIVLKSWKSSTTSPTEIKLEWNDQGRTTQSTLVKGASDEASAWNEFTKLIENGKFRFVYKPKENYVNLNLVFDEMD